MDPAQPPASPLDPVMAAFLGFVEDQANGYVGSAKQKQEAAAMLDIPDALVEAMYTSARARALLEPDFNARGRTRWILSRQGHAFLDRHAAT